MSSIVHPLHTAGAIVDLVQRDGADAALASLRSDRPAIHDGAYHDTRAVFLVWAAQRLLDAGLSRTSVLWHPLVHVDSPLVWWDADVLDSDVARDGFVAPTHGTSAEPAPCEPTRTLVAA